MDEHMLGAFVHYLTVLTVRVELLQVFADTQGLSKKKFQRLEHKVWEKQGPAMRQTVATKLEKWAWMAHQAAHPESTLGEDLRTGPQSTHPKGEESRDLFGKDFQQYFEEVWGDDSPTDTDPTDDEDEKKGS